MCGYNNKWSLFVPKGFMERKIPERGNSGTNFLPRNNKNEQSKKRIERKMSLFFMRDATFYILNQSWGKITNFKPNFPQLYSSKYQFDWYNFKDFSTLFLSLTAAWLWYSVLTMKITPGKKFHVPATPFKFRKFWNFRYIWDFEWPFLQNDQK